MEIVKGISGIKKWYVVYTNPRAEKKVNERLTEEGIETFFPTHVVLRQWSDRKKRVVEPLFKSYMFVHCTTSDFQKILNTDGVVCFVYYLKKPAIVLDREILEIRKLIKKVDGSTISIEKNEAVEVVMGPLVGQRGVVEMVGKQIVRVRIGQLGISLVAEIHKTNLRKLA